MSGDEMLKFMSVCELRVAGTVLYTSTEMPLCLPNCCPFFQDERQGGGK